MHYTICSVLFRLIACALVLFPFYSNAGQANIPGFYGTSAIRPPAPLQLPQLKQPSVAIPGISGIETNPAKNHLVIRQNQPKAIIDWSSFDIGADAWTQFDQQGNATWVALNRIWDSKPSLIYGKLTADGKIYLINQNGILFGPGSKVNVHSLIASALTITDENFLKDIFRNKNRILVFKQTEDADRLAAVSNEGEIVALRGGSIFFIAPRVENAGVIDAPAGQIGLAAGTEVTLAQPDANDLSRSGYYVLIADEFPNSSGADATFGQSVNRQSGRMSADGGMVGMYGNNVDQWGVIRSTTAFKNKKGVVELRAANRVATGEESVISLPVDVSLDPETGKIRTISETFDIQPEVTMRGLHAWSSTDSIVDTAYARWIEHRGTIVAPTGYVTLHAADRVFLETGSRIDVKGVVADLPAPVIADFKLNTVELRDAYGQKGGVLQGQKITTPLIAGSTIGDLSQAILTQDRTAVERCVGGATRTRVDETTGVITYNNPQIGQINILAADGDVIVKQGAILDFSGGAIHYRSGFVDSTMLLAGTKIYDISSAPLSIRYDKLMGQYKRTFEKFGIREEYNGLYYGGSSPLKTYVDSYVKGGDAGKLSLSASTIVLDGTIVGGVERGVFQKSWTMRGSFSGKNAGSDFDLAMALSERRGLEVPRTGTLEIVPFDRNEVTHYPREIAIVSERRPRSELLPDSPTLDEPTRISAEILNSAGLGTLNLAANLTISIEEDAAIGLEPGGSFSAKARRVEHLGEITVPGGSVRLIANQNLTTEKDSRGHENPPEQVIQLEEKIVLGPKSRLDVSGERIDNRNAAIKGLDTLGFAHTTGGSIAIKDQTDHGKGVFIQSGAVVDVSGGYVINPNGTVAGGSAGLLDIQGANILLDGDLRGYALSDENGSILGGSVSIRSVNIRVAPTSYALKDAFVLAGDRFRNTGFTQIKLLSFNDTVIEPKTILAPSLVRLKSPVNLVRAGDKVTRSADESVAPDLVRLDDALAYMAGPSSLVAVAGEKFDGSVPGFTGNLKEPDVDTKAKVVVSQGATLRTFPGGSSATRIANDVVSTLGPVRTGIVLEGPSVDVQGILESPAGTVRVEATHTHVKTGPDTRIFAGGYNRPDPASTPKGFPVNYQPVAAGSVSLSAHTDLILASKAVIDISGSEEVQVNMRSTDGSLFTFFDAGDPGSLSLSYGGNLSWSGTVKVERASSQRDRLRGGTLSITKTELGQEEAVLHIGQKEMKMYQSAGFDDITLRSLDTIRFTGSIDAATGRIGRKLTLDAPVIDGASNTVELHAPWVVLTNRTQPVTTSGSASKGSLSISGEWIDVIGSTRFTGFESVTLKAGKDIRLSEALYNDNIRGGTLFTSRNLTLDADRIYPSSFYTYKGGRTAISTGVYSDFTMFAGGKLTVRNSSESAAEGPIYSAGGSLTVQAGEGIELMRGVCLAAPMGTISLDAPGKRILLAGGSTITTTGNPHVPITYGIIDNSNLWITDDKISIQNAVLIGQEQMPRKSVTVNADTAIVMDGAVVDVSGGGSVFAFKFLPGIEGSNDPLSKAGRYVVLKETSFPLPGSAIYLREGGGLREGLYTILPLDASNPQNARYAFLPGACILEAQKGTLIPTSGQQAYGTLGYPLTVGYSAVADTDIIGTRPRVFAVRTAADVLSEGYFVLPEPLQSGDGGSVTVKGGSAIINGIVRASPLTGYEGGVLHLSGRTISIQAAPESLAGGFGFATPLPDKMRGVFRVTASGVAGQGFHEIKIGDANTTETITVGSKAVLEAPLVTCAASRMIMIETGAEIHGVSQSGNGSVTLSSPSGSAVLQQGALVHASHAFNLNVGRPNLEGDLEVDSSALMLQAREIVFVKDKERYTGGGLAITEGLWSRFSGCEDISLVSGSDVSFMDDFDVTAASSISIDAARIVGLKENGTVVGVNAPSIRLSNSGSASATLPARNGGSITFAGDTISVGEGSVLIGGFADVHLNTAGEVILRGAGSLCTGNADLTITTARVKTAHAPVENAGTGGILTTPVRAPHFHIEAGSGVLKLEKSVGTAGVSPAAGGILELSGRSIEVSTILQMDSGTLTLRTVGSPDSTDDGIVLRSGAAIYARGTDRTPGGKVILSTGYADASGGWKSGNILLEEGSLVDVSAGGQGDAGMVSLTAPERVVTIGGILKGSSHGSGTGGSFILDAKEIGDVTELNKKLTARFDDQGELVSGGFTGAIDLRARRGAISVPDTLTMTANHIKLQADDQGEGRITVAGTLDTASGSRSGRVELYAANDLVIEQSGKILTGVASASADGGSVILGSSRGWVDLKAGGIMDVPGGTVYLRAERDDQDVKIRLNGAVRGASAVTAEAVKYYTFRLRDGLDFELVDTVLTASTGISSFSISEGNRVSFVYDGRLYTATLEARAHASGDELASALETALNTASYTDFENDGSLVPLAGALFAVDYGKTVPGRLSIRNVSPNDSDILNFSAPAQFGFASGSTIRGVASEYLSEASSYYATTSALSRLKAEAPAVASVMRLLPGIEVVNETGDISVGKTDFLTTRFDGDGVREPGALTLRAAGNLNIGRSMSDNPTPREVLNTATARPTWSYALVAGADIGAADPLSVVRGRGTLSVPNTVVVYSENAPIRFASGSDTIIGSGLDAGHMINRDMRYSLASYAGSVRGQVGRDLVITGGAIQTATGDIALTVGRDLQLNLFRDRLSYVGSVRTTGQTAATITNEVGAQVQDLGQYWTYRDGGDISIDVGRYVGWYQQGRWVTALDGYAWDAFAKKTVVLPLQPGQTRPTEISYGLFSASYEQSFSTSMTPTSGLATMGGGSLSVRSGGHFLAQAGTFGAGDLSIVAGGDIRGRFLVRSGSGELHAAGNIGSAAERQQIELFGSRMDMTAAGEVQLAAVLNPTLASDKNRQYRDNFIDCSYSLNTAVSMRAGTDAVLTGKSPFYRQQEAIEETILPPTVDIEAGGSINLLSYHTLTSSPTGNLRLVAGRDIRGVAPDGSDQYHMLLVSDIAPEYWYGLFQIYGTPETGRTWIAERTVNDTIANNKHGFYKDAEKQASTRPIHAVQERDSEEVKALKTRPIEISAGGDIKTLKLYLPKRAEITARGRIENVMYEGQNNNATDISKIQAGRDISMAYVRSDEAAAILNNQLEGIVQGGPGIFFVQSGGSIDLGTLRDGIQTIGNGRYAQLGTERSALFIVSGYTFDETHEVISSFFTKIRSAGDKYAELLAEGKVDEGEALLKETRDEVIKPFLRNPSGDGDINMTSSQIATSIGRSDIFIIAAGNMNLGQTALPVSGTVNKKTGITTGGGGAINIFARKDVNVNESRVMTFLGGDITIWSDDGNINAGRGSRTAVSASPPKVLDDGTKVFSPPAIGSGIRAVTYGDNAPEPGNIHLFAPSGIIDAGEAEISGSKIVLAALQVLNVQNIIFSAGSIGVPQPSTGAVGIGTISGSGALAQASQLTSEASSLAASRAAEASKVIEDIMARWLDVKVIDFVLDEKDKEE